MNIPDNLRYTKTHEWASVNGKTVKSGLTEYAQKELSDVVYIELPQIGKKVKQGESIAIVESVKAAFDIYAPVSGEISAVNKNLEADPSLINRDSYGAGWLFEIKTEEGSGIEKLMDKDAYSQLIAQAAH